MLQILTHIDCNDMFTPLRSLINKRRLVSHWSASEFPSAYRDILFLTHAYFGGNIMDHGEFWKVNYFV